jgi:hypothetical protein
MEISGNLVLYVGGEPVAACTEAAFDTATLHLESYDQPPVLCTAVPEWNLTVAGKWPELTRLEALTFEWYVARRMPRKKKKSYRKRLEKAIAYERYRKQVDEFLSKIGPENG